MRHPKTTKTVIACSRAISATHLDRLAGLYVTGDQGLLLAAARRDINLTAAEVSNTHGDSQLLARRDLNLETLTLSQQSELPYSAGNNPIFATAQATPLNSGPIPKSGPP